MTRNIVLTGAAIAAVLAGGAGTAAAAPKAKAKKSRPTPVTLSCSLSLAQQPMPGQDTVYLGASTGIHYGRNVCGKGFGEGVISDTFTVPDSGDTVGKFKQYFGGGMVFGRFDLTPGGGDELSTSSFGSQTFDGTITLSGGTGRYKGITSARKAGGVMKCTTLDSIHMKCTMKLKALLPA